MPFAFAPCREAVPVYLRSQIVHNSIGMGNKDSPLREAVPTYLGVPISDGSFTGCFSVFNVCQNWNLR